nr:MAG TPA: Orsellinic acid biosynthesis cluster protein D [Caudoviricetes sp.]
MVRMLIHKIRKHRFCKNNGYRCPECIYHEFVFNGIVFRGIRCLYRDGSE